MKILIEISLLFIFLPFIAGSCTNAQAVNNLTDKFVLTELEKLDGKKYIKDAVCIKKFNESAKIVVIGVKDDNSLCRFDGMFIDSRYFEKDSPEWSKTALFALGWENANEQARERLAKLWVQKALFAFSTKANQTFYAVPQVNDGVKVIVSVKMPPGVTSRNAAKIFIFDKEGNMTARSDY